MVSSRGAPEVIRARGADGREVRVLGHDPQQPRDVGGGRDVALIEARELDEVSAAELELHRLAVHRGQEFLGREARLPHQHAGRDVVRAHEAHVQQVLEPHHLMVAQLGAPGAVELGPGHLDVAGEVRLLLEEHQVGHQLGEARDRGRGARVLLVQHLAGERVHQDGVARVDDAARGTPAVPADGSAAGLRGGMVLDGGADGGGWIRGFGLDPHGRSRHGGDEEQGSPEPPPGARH